jgi:PAS domain S-box-containing protein
MLSGFNEQPAKGTPKMARQHTVPKKSSAASDLAVDDFDRKDEYWRLMTADQELAASRERYARLYDFAPVGYATLDLQGCIRDINLTGAKILGRSRGAVTGGTLLSLVTRTDRWKFLNYLSLVRTRNNAVTTELHFQRPGEMQTL